MVVVLMGVSGSGKTTVGKALARELGWPFLDADDLHPAANVEKLRRGIPLTDEDRAPWLKEVATKIDAAAARGANLVLACSALKHSYREFLRHDHADVVYFCLCGPKEVIAERLSRRQGHFMNPGLLSSQFATLEADQDSIKIDVRGSVPEIVRQIRGMLGR
jgi:gluconokinase